MKSGEHLRRVQALFDEALLHPEGSAREGYLDAACGDDSSLREQVTRIVRGYEKVAAASNPATVWPRYGAYQTRKLIGRGGMGAVYLAERADGEFRMQVAVKVVAGILLSATLEESFKRERQILAELSHSNVARLFDGGIQDGVPYLVMEYVDGLPLDIYCQQAQLDTRARLHLLCTVCEAVEYAHSRGVIHRDLKPSNVLVTPEGVVKLLDFGAARLLDAQSQPGATVSTLRGFTPEYASPELIEGRSVAASSDVYALGVLLGRLCDPAKDSTLRAIIQRATRRNPEARYATVTAFRHDLARRAVNKRIASQRRRQWAAIAGFCVVGAVALWLARNWSSRSTPFVRLNDSGTHWRSPSLSAGGRWLAYSSDQAEAGNYDIWLRDLSAAGRGKRLTRGSEPSVSPDGQFAAFYSDREPAGLYRVVVESGEVKLLTRGGRTPKYSPDGKWIAFATNPRQSLDMIAPGPQNQVLLIPSGGGEARLVSRGLVWARSPVWSRDGKNLFFLGSESPSQMAIWTSAVGEGGAAQPTKGMDTGNPVIYEPCAAGEADGLFFAIPTGDSYLRRVLWRFGIGGYSSLAAPDPNGGDLTDCATGADGQIVVETRIDRTTRWIQPINSETGVPTGSAVRLPHIGTRESVPALSANGKRMAFSTLTAGSSAGATVWLEDMVLGKRWSTPGSANDSVVHLSPDGEVLWFEGADAGGVFPRRLVGDRLQAGPRSLGGVVVWDTNNDGSRLLRPVNVSARRAIALLDSRDGSEATILAHPGCNLYVADWSLDERWVVFEAQCGRGSEIFAAPMRGAKQVPYDQWIGLGKGEYPKWSPEGKRLYFVSMEDGYRCIWQMDSSGGGRKPLSHFHGAAGQFLKPGTLGFSVARDKIAYLTAERDESIWLRR